jgi:putative ABC transport system permease protein
MLVAAIAVLAIACVNVANLQFARAASRVRELAMRGALGASRGRLLCQVLTEGMLLVLAGSIAGTALAAMTTRFFYAAMAQLPFGGVPGWVTADLDLTVLVFTVGVGAVAILGSSLAPAWFASRVQAGEVLKAGGHGQSNRFVTRIGRTLVIVQIGLGCALLITALLQVKSIVKHAGLSFGFDLESIVAGRMDLEPGYRSVAARRAFYQRFLRELRTEPELAHVALTSRSLAIMGGLPARVQREGDGGTSATDGDATLLEYVSDGYFATLGLRLRAGREFESGEWERGRASVLVNESFARKYFSGGNAIGNRIRVTPDFGAAAPVEWRTIVGVVPDTRLQGPLTSRTDGAGVFLPLEATSLPYPTVLARGRAANGNVAERLRRAVARLDPDLSLYGLSTARERLHLINGQARAIAGLFTVFGAVAAILAAVGLYSVTSFTVAARTREFGIRMALGAAAPRVFRDILREGARQFLIGSVAGTALALAVVQLGDARIESFLHQVSPRDPTIYGAVILTFAAITFAGCWAPARRATKVDPMVALRCE